MVKTVVVHTARNHWITETFTWINLSCYEQVGQ